MNDEEVLTKQAEMVLSRDPGITGGQSKEGEPFRPRICSKTLTDCVAPGLGGAIHLRPLDAVACMLTCAALMTSSQSKASNGCGCIVRPSRR